MIIILFEEFGGIWCTLVGQCASACGMRFPIEFTLAVRYDIHPTIISPSMAQMIHRVERLNFLGHSLHVKHY